MKVVILAGGFGTRISEESHLKPKPMIEIDGQPILWHIMKEISHFGLNEFIICCGYKGHIIKEYFANYYLHRSNITYDFTKENSITIHNNLAEPWKVTLVDTGLNTMTGGRIKRVKDFIGDEPFLMTYGDGVSDIDINKLIAFHDNKKVVATLTAIRPGGRFGMLDIDDKSSINCFAEKHADDGGWINGGFMILEPSVFDYIEGDHIMFEREPLESLANEGKLNAYMHYGFWKCMDTLRDKQLLEKLIIENRAPWMVWDND